MTDLWYISNLFHNNIFGIMRRINRCLNKQLLDLCQRAVQLDDLNLKLGQYLPPTLREHCSVGSFNKGCLLVVTSNPNLATELRYYLPTLRDRLRAEAGLYQLISIKIQIIADQYSQSRQSIAKARTPQLSDSAKNSVHRAGELCTYPPLKEILFRLAGSKE